MSPGALYRYFPSQEAIVAAICEADREDDVTCFGALQDATSALDGLVDGAMAHITHTMTRRASTALCRDALRADPKPDDPRDG